MRKTFFLAILMFVIFASLHSYAQETEDKRNIWIGVKTKKIDVNGDLMVIKNEKTFNVEISFKNSKMGAKGQPDSLYEATRVKEYNDKKPGSGDQWLIKWNETKENFKPAFIEGFNTVVSKNGVYVGNNDSNASYTFVLYPKQMMEFMGSVYFILDMEVRLTKEPNTIIASLKFPMFETSQKSKKFKGKFTGAYCTAGYYLGIHFKKNIYK
jgi:hypothetical protein